MMNLTSYFHFKIHVLFGQGRKRTKYTELVDWFVEYFCVN